MSQLITSKYLDWPNVIFRLVLELCPGKGLRILGELAAYAGLE